MFYIKEILFRAQYAIFSLILIISLSYFYKNVLFFLLTYKIMSNTGTLKNFGVDYFIYTHPSELFSTYLTIVFCFSILIFFALFIWNILDFLKPSLFFFEYFYSQIFIILFYIIFFIFNVFCFTTLFPLFWLFFESFNNSFFEELDHFNVFLELRVDDYFLFLISFIYLINCCLFLFLLLLFFCVKYGLNSFLHWKKLFIFLNIVFATLLSPPDVISQVFILIILTIMFEFIIFFYIIIFKIFKFSKLLIWQ